MSFTADFYTSGPYLHNPPTKGYVDRYTQAFGGQGLDAIGNQMEEMTARAVAKLRDKARVAAGIEAGFYRLFGVGTANEWSDKYLLSREAGGRFQSDITKILESRLDQRKNYRGHQYP